MIATLFGSLAAVVLAVSIWIGLTNKTKYEEQIALRQKAEKVKASKEDDLSKQIGKLKDITDKRDKTVAENKQRTQELDELVAKNEKLAADKLAKQRKLEELEEEKATADEKLKTLPDADILVPKIKKDKNAIAQLKSSVEQEQANLARLTQTETDTKAQLENLNSVVRNQVAGASQPTLRTNIRAVYNNWGFVTLPAGDAQGVVPGSTLDVWRDGEVVAQLEVTAVEPHSATADILKDTVVEGVSLRSGDAVKATAPSEDAAPVL